MKTLFLVICTIIALGSCQDPPETWQEHWFEHNQLVTRNYFDSDVAIYFDDDVDKSITWMNQYLHDVWVYVKNTYGGFGSDPRLFAVFHSGKYSGGHPSTYFDDSHDNRNAIDVGSSDPNAWHSGDGNDLDIVTHEVGHIVEGASKGVHNSPAFNIWGDSKWAEIFIYDVYLGLNRPNDAQRWRDLQVVNHDDFPRPNTYWFRDWFLPIYEQHGGTQTLNNFFELLAQNFPKIQITGGQEYTRDMNHGEFVHFWSGAAGTNLKDQATTAFGWPDQYEQEFNQARQDFPNISY